MAHNLTFSARRVMDSSWKLILGAISITAASVTIPAIQEFPNAHLWIGLCMIGGAGVLLLVSVLDHGSYQDRSERLGQILGSSVVAAFGFFMTGWVTALPSPEKVSDGLQSGVVRLSQDWNTANRTSAASKVRLTIQAAAGAESLAQLVQARLDQNLGERTIRDGARSVQVSALASGRFTNLAAGHYQGRLDVRMKASGETGVCEFSLTGAGIRTVSGTADQLTDQLTPRVVALMEGTETC